MKNVNVVKIMKNNEWNEDEEHRKK